MEFSKTDNAEPLTNEQKILKTLDRMEVYCHLLKHILRVSGFYRESNIKDVAASCIMEVHYTHTNGCKKRLAQKNNIGKISCFLHELNNDIEDCKKLLKTNQHQ